METQTMHKYPSYITDPIHKMRSLRIIVKENVTFDGNTDKFKAELKKYKKSYLILLMCGKVVRKYQISEQQILIKIQKE